VHTAFAGLLGHAKLDHTSSYVVMVKTGSALVTHEQREGALRDASRL
jgi:hypothetical protein